MLYCHFIARSRPEPEAFFGAWRGKPLTWVRYRELAAAVQPAPAGGRSTPELMLEYTAALTAVWRRATVLPLRFGDRFRSEAGVLRLLRERRRELVAALERLEGKAEMSLRAPAPAGEAAEMRAAELERIARPLESVFEVQRSASGDGVLEVAHLIDRAQASEYRSRLRGCLVTIAGPFPPFHFLPRFLRLPVRAERRPARQRAAAAG